MLHQEARVAGVANLSGEAGNLLRESPPDR
jgi:hypothetical protein